MLTLVTAAPDPRLAAYARGYTGYDEVTTGPMRRAEFPGARGVVILDLGEPLVVHRDGIATRTPRGGFAGGLDDRAVITETAGAMRGVQVDLTAAGARLCFGIPMHELAGRMVGLEELLGPGAGELIEQLHEDATWAARFARIDRALAARLARGGRFDPGIAWAWAQLERSGGRIAIGGLARELGISHRLLIARFRDQIGMAPKQVARLLRFERLTARLRRGAPVRWAELALELGFSDQAHLGHEVRDLAGMSPTELLARLG